MNTSDDIPRSFRLGLFQYDQHRSQLSVVVNHVGVASVIVSSDASQTELAMALEALANCVRRIDPPAKT